MQLLHLEHLDDNRVNLILKQQVQGQQGQHEDVESSRVESSKLRTLFR